MNATSMNDWRRGGVIYQIYPRSFCDSNGDGVGDLPGVASKIGYVQSLGVDGVWLSPFFPSPMKDFGYDVSNYRDVDPLFGAMDDFDGLLRACREAGLKLIIDQVYSHTSDCHPWFEESRRSREGPKADWYLWAEAKPDGGPPNNWLSVFGGPAWTWDARRRQYYLHNFLAEQPDLNFRSPAVREEILDVARFWLERGVDGLRLDVANCYYSDAALRDNPPRADGADAAHPYDCQRHLYDRSQPENLAFIEALRALTDRYEGRFMVGEIFSDAGALRSMEYCAPGRLHTAYNFHFLQSDRLSAALVRDGLTGWSRADAWPSWSFSNHDVARAQSRWGGEAANDSLAKLLLGLLMCLRGTIFLYQGEELGLPQARMPFERLQDPEGIRFWPDNLGRDGARTPMPWRGGAPHAGFSKAEPWLPVDARHHALAVDRQADDASSTLNHARRFIAFRRKSRALRHGAIEFVDAPEPIVAFFRRLQDECLLCVFNLGPAAQSFNAPVTGKIAPYGLSGAFEHKRAELPGYGGLVVHVQP